MDVGDGKIPALKFQDNEDEASEIEVPDNFLLQANGDYIEIIALKIYVNFKQNYNDTEYLKE